MCVCGGRGPFCLFESRGRKWGAGEGDELTVSSGPNELPSSDLMRFLGKHPPASQPLIHLTSEHHRSQVIHSVPHNGLRSSLGDCNCETRGCECREQSERSAGPSLSFPTGKEGLERGRAT